MVVQGGAEDFVALDHGVDGGGEGGDIEAGGLVGPGDVVARGPGGELPQEPQPFLAVRCRDLGSGCQGLAGDGRGGGGVGVVADPGGLPGDGGVGEDLVQGEMAI